MTDAEPHVRILKAIADATRLRILGLLAASPLSGRELAAELGLSAATVSHHMARLVEVGVVRVTVAGTRRIYHLDGALLPADPPADQPAVDDATTPDAAFRDRTLRAFFRGERLVSIPSRRKQRVVVLQRLLEGFVPGRDYPEREVNEVLAHAHDDVATLRRELVDYGYLTRAAGVYRIAERLPERSAQEVQEVPPGEAAWLSALIQQGL